MRVNSPHLEIVEAVRAGELGRVEALLAEDPELAGTRDASGLSLLMLACYRRRPEVIARIRAIRPERDIFEAASVPGGEARGAELLGGQAALAQSWSPDGFSPMHLAAFFDNPTMVRLLLRAGADPNTEARNGSRLRPLHSAAAGHSAESARLLLDAGADPDAFQRGGWTALHSAAQHDDRDLIELLLARGADPSPRSDDGRTPLDLAVEAGNTRTAGRLRSARATRRSSAEG